METCKNVGFEFWQARKAKGWTRAQASAITKLRVGWLEALESNNFAALPPIGYLCKHLRDYVRELNIDDNIITRYIAQFQPNDGDVVAAPGIVETMRSHLLAPLRRVALIAILVLAGLLFLNAPRQFVSSDQAASVVEAASSAVETSASFGAVRETSRNIAISSRLSQ